MAQTKVQLLQPNLGDVIDFDSSTLFMDGADNRVGIRNTNPQYELDVTGTVNATNFRGNISVGTIDDWITHSGDTNTKFGFPGADQFEIHAGGGPKVHVNSSGYVGINTSTMSNSERLAVQLGNDEMFELRSAAQELFQVWKEGSTEECRLNVKHGGSTKIHIRGNGKSYFNGGHLGVGDTNPDTRLSVTAASGTDVVGKFTSTDAKAWIQFRDNSTTDTGVMIGAEGDDLMLRAGSNERVRITSGGDLRLGLSTVANVTDSAHYIMTLTGKSGQTGAGAIAFKDPSGNTDGFIFADGGNLYITADYDDNTTDSSIRFRVDGSSEKVRITKDGALISSNFALGVDDRWKIRPNTSNTELAFEYSTSASLADTNIKMMLDSDGRVIIGDTSVAKAHANADDLVVGNTSSGKRTGITLVSATDHDGAIHFSRGTSSSNNNIKGQIVYTHASGNAYADSMRFYTDVSTRLSITATGEVNIGGNYTQTTAPLCVTTDANDYGIRLQTGSNVIMELLNNDSAGNCELRGYYNNNSGTRGEGFRLEANGETYFNPGGNTGLNIKSDGKVGINHSAALKGTLQIKSHTNGWAGGIILEENHADKGWNIHPDDSDNLMFGRNTNTTGDQATHKMSLESGGDINLVDGNLKLASGHGIDFSATSNASSGGASVDSELLDDYEEGTLTLTLVGQYGGSASYSYRVGRYVKVGSLVHVTGDMRFNGNWSGNSGNLYMELPFTSFSAGGTVGNGIVAEWNLSNSSWDNIMLQVDNNVANAKFTSHSGANNNTSYLQTGSLGNGRWIKFGLTYHTHL